MARVLVIGADIQSELAVLQKLRELVADTPAGTIATCHDMTICDLLIVSDGSPLSNVLDRIVHNHPDLPLWLLDADGSLRDRSGNPPGPLGEDAIRSALHRITHGTDIPAANNPGAQADPPPAPPVPEPAPAPEPEPEPAPTPEPEPAPVPVPEPAPVIAPAAVATSASGNAPPPPEPPRPAAAPAPNPPATPEPGDFPTALHRLANAHAGAATLLLDGRPLALLDFAVGTALPANGSGCTPEDFEAALTGAFSRLQLEPLPPEHITAAGGATHPHATPLPRLLWRAGLSLPDVNLLPPGTPALRLSSWPDFRMLAHHHDHFRLCSLLLRQACTANEAASLLSLELRDVRAFFNAAWLSGYGHSEQAPGVTPASATATRRGAGALLAGMWRRMRGRTEPESNA